MSGKLPVLIIIAGPNGAGKTMMSQRIMSDTWSDGCVYINPDEIAKNKFGDWNSPECALKAAKEAHRLRAECLEAGQSMAVETVMSTKEEIDFIASAKNSGYFIRLFFVGTDDPEINAARIAQRYKLGGHIVPIDKIVDRYYKSIANCANAVRMADFSYVYDNSVSGADIRLLFKAENGAITQLCAEMNRWAVKVSEHLARVDNFLTLTDIHDVFTR